MQKNRTRRRFLPNLHTHRFWVATENRWITLRLTSKGMRIIDKKGIDSVLQEMRDAAKQSKPNSLPTRLTLSYFRNKHAR